MDKLDIINNIINGSPNRMREQYFIKNNKDIYNEIILYTCNISDILFKFKVWHWINNKPNYILCTCGNRVNTNISWKDGYRIFCSTKCSSNNFKTKEKLKNTLFKKYGVDHYSKTNECKEKYFK